MNETIEFLSPITSRFVIAMLATAFAAYAAVRLSWGHANKLSRAWPIYILRGLLLATLLFLFLNPVRITEQKGVIEPAQVFFLLDASESMAIGNEEATRWDQAVNLIRGASKAAFEAAAAEINLFRFGRRLKAVDSPATLGLDDTISSDGMGVSFAQKTQSDDQEEVEEPTSPANEPDTQMFVALRQISSRFGRKPPAAVVVFSDGRARDASQANQVAEAFTKLGVPIHCVPVGNTESGGDVALVSLVVPTSARKQSEVQAQAFLRSYGFDGRRVEIKLSSIDDAGRRTRRLATVPVTLESGFQSVPITFRTDSETQVIEALVSDLPNEVSTDNNRFETEIMITREKIRVLYVEGSRMRSVPVISANGRRGFEGPTTRLQNSLQEDDDIECRAVQVSVARLGLTSSQLQSFPQSVAELSSFDAIVLSDVPRRTFSEKQLGWIESWVRQRGGGLCMVGGRNSYGAGGWQGSVLKKVLPVQFSADSDWRSDAKISLQADVQGKVHPLFRFTSEDERNRKVVASFPGFHGTNVGLQPKPNLARVLAVAHPGELVPAKVERSPLFSAQGIRDLVAKSSPKSDSTEIPKAFPAITVGQYGKGRTMAMPMPITGNPASDFLSWGRTENGNEYYAQFWRNVVYWLTEQSYIGRRRLVANADKRYYGPSEIITLTGAAFDESANETSGYRLSGVIEPQSFDNIESEFSIVRWPNNVPRTEEVNSPFVLWGEEFDIPVTKVAGRDIYQIELELAETLPSGTANQSLRLELTAYEDQTQVDSTSVPIQILHDPFEQQNPFPDHELLTTLSENSGGQVLPNQAAISNMLETLPITRGPSEMTMAPIWSKWWLLCLLIGCVSAEWCYRRWIGLA